MGFVVDLSQVIPSIVDKERDVTIVNWGTGPDEPHRLELLMNNKKITIYAEKNEKLNSYNKYDVYWNIDRVFLLEDTNSCRKNIINLITEALNIYGMAARDDLTNSVTVNFNHAFWG